MGKTIINKNFLYSLPEDYLLNSTANHSNKVRKINSLSGEESVNEEDSEGLETSQVDKAG